VTAAHRRSLKRASGDLVYCRQVSLGEWLMMGVATLEPVDSSREVPPAPLCKPVLPGAEIPPGVPSAAERLILVGPTLPWRALLLRDAGAQFGEPA
jgi:hypothetical protein